MGEEHTQGRQLHKQKPEPAHATGVDLLALLGFGLLTLLMLWPLSLHLAEALQDTSDSLLNLLIISRQVHQLLVAPFQLFDINIFYPYPNTLAYSEILFPSVLLSVPILVFTDNAILTYNLMFLLSFTLSAFGLYLLAYCLSGHRYAALMAGLVFAFSPYRAAHLSQLPLLTMQWMPLTLLYLDRYLGRRKAKDGLLFCGFFVAQSLSCLYYAFFTGLAVGLYLLYYFGLRWRRVSPPLLRLSTPQEPCRSRAFRWETALCCDLLRLACLGGLIAILLTPFALPYLQVSRELGLERSLSESVAFSLNVRQIWKSQLLPCWIALLLTLLGFFLPARRQSPDSLGQRESAFFYLILALFGLVMALGPTLQVSKDVEWPALPMPYRFFFDYFPGFKALRDPGRFFTLTTLSLGVLAALGMAGLEKVLALPLARQGWRWVLRVGILVLVLYPLSSRSLAHVKVAFIEGRERLSSVYRWLARQPPTVIVELPLAFHVGPPPVGPVDPAYVWPTHNIFRYQYFSTYHWQESIDGYSSFVPTRHGEIDQEMAYFPSERAISLLQGLDVEYVVLHEALYRAYEPERWSEIQAALPAFDELTLVEQFGQDYVYRLQPRTQTQDSLEVRGFFPPQVVPGEEYTAYLLIANEGARSYIIKPTERLGVMATWRAEDGRSSSRQLAVEMPLVTSMVSVVPVSLPSPATPGKYHLLLKAAAGPLPSFSLEGPVSVAARAERAAKPVPVRLYDYSLDRDRYAPGDILRLTLYWGALGRLVDDCSISVKLRDMDGTVLAQQDRALYQLWRPEDWWQGGITFHQYELQIPWDAPLGLYRLQVSLYRPTDLSRLLPLDEEIRPVEEPFSIGVKIAPLLEPGQLSIPHPLEVNLGDQVTLLGYDVSSEAIYPGQPLDLTLYWQARRRMSKDYTVFTHLVAADGRIVAQQDNQPAEGRYPTSIWDTGEIVVDRYHLIVTPDTAAGEYHLETGMYLLSTLERLKVVGGDEKGQDRIRLSRVRVRSGTP